MSANVRETKHRPLTGISILALLLLVGLGTAGTALAEGKQKTFATPDDAAKALIAAAAANDNDALLAIYGPDGKELVRDARDPIVRAERKSFVNAARDRIGFERLKSGAVELVVGRDGWPFPILLVQEGGRWRFDAAEGKEEILARRVGKNELEAIEILLAYVEAQRAYARGDRDGDQVREYAQKILSTPGQKDGLYWEVDPDSAEELSPLGPAVISLAEHLADTEGEKVPFNGYYWKVLKTQGKHAPGGAHSYLINGNMIAGFALVGVPAKYRNTGVMTFLVSHHGKMFEKDLGERSLDLAKAMDAFDPDDTWKEVKEEQD